MAIQGPAYVKTKWAFEERPVASAKLNTWDDRIEAALELAFFLLNEVWGGADGVIRGPAAGELAVSAKASPGMAAMAEPGFAFISGLPFKLATAVETVDVSAPANDPRIDLVQASLAGWNVTVKPGVEASVPEAPSADTHCLPLAQLYLRPGMASIKNADDGVNGYIADVRVFV